MGREKGGRMKVWKNGKRESWKNGKDGMLDCRLINSHLIPVLRPLALG